MTNTKEELYQELKRIAIEAGMPPEYFYDYPTVDDYMAMLYRNFEEMTIPTRDKIALKMGEIEEDETIRRTEDGHYVVCKKELLN